MQRLSPSGRKFIQREEGYIPTVYWDAVGKVPTIGYGHAIFVEDKSARFGYRKATMSEARRMFPNRLTPAEGEALLDDDVAPAEAAVRKVKVELAANEFDSLVSFVFNIGVNAFTRSTLRGRLKVEDWRAVPREWRRWIYAAGKVSEVLQGRREREITVWLGCAHLTRAGVPA